MPLMFAAVSVRFELGRTCAVGPFLGINIALEKLERVHKGEFLANDLLILLVDCIQRDTINHNHTRCP